jgi:hypothetical protein
MILLRLVIIASITCGLIGLGHAAEPAKPAPAVSPTQVPDTLMFSVDELNDVQSRAASVTRDKDDKKKENSNAIENAKLYLSTILYYGPNDWTIWVNGIAIGPKQEFQSFQITDIKPNYVELTVPLSALGMRPVKLSPNQTFIVASGTVVEGPWQ